MLASLSIRDIVLIDRLDLTFEGGLTVLTGETGAGKSILMDAFALALGGRGDAGLVRAGEAQGQITAAFDVPLDHPVHARIKEEGVDAEDGEVILRRVQAADGRAKASLNGQPVSVNVLRAVGEMLVEIHGQHADRALIDPATHRDLLDAFGGHTTQTDRVSKVYRTWREISRELETRRNRLDEAQKEADYVRHVVEELDELAPEEGEEERLATERQTMMQGEKVAADLNEIQELFVGTSSPTSLVVSLMRRVERKGAEPGSILSPLAEALARAADSLGEVENEVDAAMRAADYDPSALERIEERLFALRAASRKHNVPVDGLADYAARMQAELADLDSAEATVARLSGEEAEARAVYEKQALALSKARGTSARKLDKAVQAELGDLRLAQARFTTQIDVLPADQGGESGMDRVEFWVQTNPGTRPGPILKVASGGELSRFLLALKVVLADKGSAPTLVFDEIDAGVGGAVAEAIGKRLARLGDKVQVLSITHAPQVAARASGHLRIRKDNPKRNVTKTSVDRLTPDERGEEIARMLAGADVSEEARAAARRLLAS
ncbi:MAG: DNA repair protein RecN [Pseudomonadota bacterium]